MNKKTIATCLIALAMLVPHLLARVGETEAEIEARYGKPVSKNAYDEIDSEYDARRGHELASRSADDRDRDLRIERLDFPENFSKDGSRIDYVGEDAVMYADSRLIFFNTGTSKWEDLRSNVLGKKVTNQESDALKRMTANARKHLRQRFYILNDVGISVVYLDGRSVCESYHQKSRFFTTDFMDTLIKKSFPNCDFDEEKADQGLTRLIRLLSPDSKEFKGCATHVDGVLTVSATPYFDFLKAIEVGLTNSAEQKQRDKLNEF